MKTKILALLNIVSFLLFTITLEFVSQDLGKWFLISGLILFIFTGVFSVFQKSVWQVAHVNYRKQSKEFFIELVRWIPSLCVALVVAISILSDWLKGGYNLSTFTSHLVVYTALTFPCHLVIFKSEYQTISINQD